MRETISIDKDFLNNTENHSIKMKPESDLRGVVTLSLFDENGDKIREVKTENVIMDWIKSQGLIKYYYNLVFNNNSRDDASFVLAPRTDTMYLSSYDQEENAKKPSFKWNSVGYAGRNETYSGSDSKKGSYNSVESKYYINDDGDEVYHLVYDFPTHASNGNINSIIWGGNYLPVLKASAKHYSGSGSLPELSTGKSFMNNMRVLFDENGCINEYYTTNEYLGSSRYRYKLIRRTIEINQLKYSEKVLCDSLETWSDHSTSNHFYDFEDCFYQLNTGTSSFVYRKYSLDGASMEKTTVTLKTAFPSVSIGSTTTWGAGFICDATKPTHYFCVGYTSGSNGGYDLKAYVYDMEGNLVIAHTLATNTSTSTSIIARGRGNKGSVNVGSHFFDETKIYSKDENWAFVSVGSTIANYFKYDCPIYAETSGPVYTAWKIVYPKYCVLTHTKLPSTVTKTNTNTMKVQYDFIYKKPSLEQFIEG